MKNTIEIQEILKRIHQGANRMGAKITFITLLNDIADHDQLVPVTAIVMLKTDTDKYSTNLFLSYCEQPIKDAHFEVGRYGMNFKEAYDDYSNRIDEEKTEIKNYLNRSIIHTTAKKFGSFKPIAVAEHIQQ